MQKAICIRYKGFSFKPYMLRVPHFHDVSNKKLTDLLHAFIRAQLATVVTSDLPAWLIDYHVRHSSVIRTKHRDISRLLTNHNWHANNGENAVCSCHNFSDDFPRTDGHVLFTGEEWDHELAHILTH